MGTLKILNRSVETRIDRIQIGRKLQQLGKKDKKTNHFQSTYCAQTYL